MIGLWESINIVIKVKMVAMLVMYDVTVDDLVTIILEVK